MERDPISDILRSKKLQIIHVPKEIYGVPFKGAISINTTLSNQANSIESAEQLTMTSVVMSSSTTALSNIANELNYHMSSLANA